MVGKISNYFPIIQSHWAVKIPNVLILHQYRWNMVRNRLFLSLMPNGMRKWAMSDTMAYRWLLKSQIIFPLFIVGELYKFQIFHWYRWNSPKRPWWSLETLWKLGIFCLGSQLWFFAQNMFFCDTWNHAWKTGWKVYVSAYEAHQLLRMCLKYQNFWNENSHQNDQDNKMLATVLFCHLKQQTKSFWLYNFLVINIWNVFIKWIIMISFDTF